MAVAGGLGKEAKSGAKSGGGLTYMVLMDGGGMVEVGAALMGTGTRDGGGDFLNIEPTLARNDLAGEGVVWLVTDRSPIPAVRESSSSLVTVVTLTPGWRLVGIMVARVIVRKV